MPLGNRSFSVVAAVFAAAFPTLAAADAPGARRVGRGGAALADTGDGGNVSENVATASLLERYELVGGGGLGPNATWWTRITAVDSRTAPVTLAAGYYHQEDNVPPTGDLQPGWKIPGNALSNVSIHQGFFVAAAYPFLKRRLSLGIEGQWDWLDSERSGSLDKPNFGASLAGKPTEQLTLAASAKDLLDLGYPDSARSLSAGARWDPGPYLGLEVAGVMALDDPDTFDTATELAFHGGADVHVVEWLALRAGYALEIQHHFVGAGIGLVATGKAAVDYGMKVQLDADAFTSWHVLDLRVNF
jgi:hypothetical protein